MAEEDVGGEEQEAEVPETPAAPSPAAAPERPPGYVPHEALHEQRETNKRIAEELRQTKERSERMEQTFQKLLSSLNEKPPPDPTKDPLGHFEHQNQALSKQLGELTEKLGKVDTERQKNERVQHLVDSISSTEEEFRSQTPDYDAAVKFLKAERREELKEIGIPASQVEKTLNMEIMSLAEIALSQGKSPAAAAYNMAKRRGYKPAAATPKLETIAKGMEASKTIDSGGGSAALTLKDLAQLPDDQLDAILQDDAKWKALVRGKSVH